tara:strand:+ start:2280 stop:2912 length:633 start_codon:yes stop_codon:yes gene_type:complete
MKHSDTYLAKDHYQLFKNVIDADELASMVQYLDESEDWRVAQVTDNGNSYMVMPTIRRQKLIEKEDTSDERLIKLLERLQTETFKKAQEDGLPIHELEVEICQLIRSDQADFFVWHADSKPGLPRCYSLLIAFNDDFIGGEIEFYNGEGNDPIMHHLEAGSALGYNSLIHSQHHKVLRGTSFMGFCVLKRSEEAHERYLESIKEESDTED